MRTWTTTDSHFGIKNGDPEWINIQRDYYTKLFIPTIKKNIKKGDILIHCGDVFDNKTSLNVQAMNTTIEIFEMFSELFEEVFVVCGNHDIFRKKSNSINSINCLKHIPKTNLIVDDVEDFNVNGKKVVLMPWNWSSEKEKEVLGEIESSDYLFAHTSVVGALYSGARRVEDGHGNTTSEFAKYGQVYTGHIHTSQKIANVRFLGSPYEITRNDKRNRKSFWCVDFDTGEEIEYINEFSPRYIDVDYNTLKSIPEKKIESFLKDNWIDLDVDIKNKDTKEFIEIIDKVYEKNSRIKISYSDPEADEESLEVDLSDIKKDGGVTVIDYIHAQVEHNISSDKAKTTMLKLMDSLYKKHVV